MLDKIDRKILIELSRNCRRPSTSLASNLRISKDMMAYRIGKLQENRIISNYVAVIDYSRLGLTNYKIYLGLNTYNESIRDEMLSYLKIIKSVSWLHTVSEDFDFVINLNEKSLHDFDTQYKDIIFRFSKYIARKQVSITREIIHFDCSFLSNEVSRNLYVTGAAKESINLTSTEMALLNAICNDAKVSFVELSSKVKKKPNSLIYALRNLERKQVILGYRAVIDYNRLGYSQYKVMLWLKDVSRKDYSAIKEAIGRIQNVIYITAIIGGQDVEFQICCRTQTELLEKINHLKNQFEGKISDIRTRLLLDEHVVNYLPVG